MRRAIPWTARTQAGFTVIELVVAVAVTGLIGSGVAAGVVHIVSVSSRNSDHTIAVARVRNATYWIRRDARMAQSVQVDAGASGFPLTLGWTEWDGTEHEVTYAITDGSLERSHSVDGGAPTVMLVAESIDADPGATNCEYTAGMLNFTVTTVPNAGSTVVETQVFSVRPRSGQ